MVRAYFPEESEDHQELGQRLEHRVCRARVRVFGLEAFWSVG